MIRRQLNRCEFLLSTVTLLTPVAAYGIAGYVRFASGLVPLKTEHIGIYPYIGLVIVTSIVWAVLVKYYQLDTFEGLFATNGKTRRVFMACGVTEMIVLTVTFFYRQTSFSRLFIWFGAFGLFLLTLIVRLAFRVHWTDHKTARTRHARLLIIGADSWAHRAAHRIMAGQVMPCTVAGYVCLEGQSPEVMDAPVYQFSEMRELAQRNGIDDVIVALSPQRLASLPELLAHLKCFCVPTRAILDIGDGLVVRDKLFNFGGTIMLDLLPSSAESLQYLVLKRIFDVFFSLAVIVITAPIMLLIAMVIWLTSSGPVIFRQERVGLNGNTFQILKFRTMKVCPPEEADTRWTLERDPRCTVVGRIIRRLSLDELPQFFNVLQGEMSVVGPRPERPHFVQRFIQGVEQYNLRHFFKAGITGWAQVNGWRGDSSIEKRIEYDLYYIRNWTFLFDVQIICLTLLRGLLNRNAY